MNKSDIIKCPECGCVQDAVIELEDWMPYPAYVHTCIKCGYVIMESEWDSQKKTTLQGEEKCQKK